MVLGPVITDFARAYPDVRLEIVVDDTSISIIEEGFDVGLRMGEMIAPDMVAVRVSPRLPVLRGRSAGPAGAQGRPEHPRDLKDLPCLNVLQTTRRNNYRWEFEEDGREFEVAVESPISINDFDFLIGLMRRSTGWA
jgi:DNA-binding transcriptional LysR family regulator